MLHEIHIAGEASYSPDGQKLSALKSINFLFGTNGSGKTTISRVIADPAAYPNCSLVWAGAPLECLVYNVDFSSTNFASQMPGIFTLGEAEVRTLEQIEELRTKSAALRQQISQLKNVLGDPDGASGKYAELKEHKEALTTHAWAAKARHRDLEVAFTGARNSRAAFCDKLLSEWSTNQAQICPIEDLRKRATTLFQKQLERHASLPSFSFDDLLELEKSPVLTKKIVGKSDLDIAALIAHLANSDWVRAGRHYLEMEPDRCPFCQQSVTDELRQKLDQYFDETFLADMAAIDRLIEAYDAYAERVQSILDVIFAYPNPFLDKDTFNAQRDRLSDRIELNKRLLAGKRAQPSTVVELEAIEEPLKELSALIAQANSDTEAHNKIIENSAKEKSVLTSEIWRHLLEESRSQIEKFKKDTESVQKAIDNISGTVETKTAELRQTLSQLSSLEAGVTSVRPTVNAINQTLASFGFTNFRLATAGDHDHLYEIVRPDGSDATPTLSEGEKSFITFLYFLHLAKGSTSSSGLSGDRVIVFDDPVSSLDSDVLFIVSTLIKSVLEEACEGTGRIKQVFILTHNIYFHKEVSYDQKRGAKCRPHETFWIVRKGPSTTIAGFDHNPIKTSYELMWAEVREPDPSSPTLQNTLRRILENYFKILGNMDRDKIIPLFEGEDRKICGSLFSWVNDGSHSVHDDLYISTDTGLTARYLDVFRRIFEQTKHLAHYEMMMGPEALARQVPDQVAA